MTYFVELAIKFAIVIGKVLNTVDKIFYIWKLEWQMDEAREWNMNMHDTQVP